MADGMRSFSLSTTIISEVLIGIHFFLLFATILFIILIYLNKLKVEQKRLMNIVRMTPVDIILNNMEIQEKIKRMKANQQ